MTHLEWLATPSSQLSPVRVADDFFYLSSSDV